jgi:hypothetical protein
MVLGFASKPIICIMCYFNRYLIFMDMCDPMDDFAPHKYTYEGQLYLLISGYE